MKHSLFFIGVQALLWVACQNGPSYRISGTCDGDGKQVYLQMFDGDKLITLDSTVVKNGKFLLNGRRDTAIMGYLTCGDKHQSLFVENGEIWVNLDEKSVGGTQANEVLQHLTQLFHRKRELTDSLKNCLSKPGITAEERKSLRLLMEKVQADCNAEQYACVRANIRNIAGATFLSDVDGLPVDTMLALIRQVPPEYMNQFLENKRIHCERVKNTGVGNRFTDFEMPTPDNKRVKLSEFVEKNKLTLVDFWASWCGPCRAEIPQVKATYERYKAKGFGVVGVSLDIKGELWRKAITDLGMDWPQMSDLKYWQCEGAKLYGVEGIPSTVLIDGQGVIIARDVYGEEMDKLVGEYLKEQ